MFCYLVYVENRNYFWLNLCTLYSLCGVIFSVGVYVVDIRIFAFKNNLSGWSSVPVLYPSCTISTLVPGINYFVCESFSTCLFCVIFHGIVMCMPPGFGANFTHVQYNYTCVLRVPACKRIENREYFEVL